MAHSVLKKQEFVFLIFGAMLSALCALPAPNAHALFEDQEKITLRKDNEQLKKDLTTITTDRDNLLKQAKTLIAEKEELAKKMDAMKNDGSASVASQESLKKENDLLKSEIEQLKAAHAKEQENVLQEKDLAEKRIADLLSQSDSLAKTMGEYPPAKIQELVEDRNRLEKENNTMAGRLLDADKKMEDQRRQIKPLELDREELHRLQAENEELSNRIRYTSKLEERQQQLLKENAEYREKVEVLKSKFKEAAPGLAKSGRISQKMMRENADMHYNLGTIFLHNKQYREAIKEYEQVLELRPSDPETHYNLGVLYDDYLKDRQKALYHYQKYLAINPKAPDVKKVETYVLSLELEQKVR